MTATIATIVFYIAPVVSYIAAVRSRGARVAFGFARVASRNASGAYDLVAVVSGVLAGAS